MKSQLKSFQLEVDPLRERGRTDSGNHDKSLFDNQLLGYKQAAKYLAISEAYLRRLKSQGKIKWVSLGSRGVRFRVSSLNRFIDEREIG